MATTTNTKKKTNLPNYLGDYMSGNYTPGYDYVSNYYNPNNGYYNPSVYGYRGNRYNVPTNAGFSMQMKDNDNYWNLGSLLGGLWGVQYNQRGAKKAGEEANVMLQDEYNKLMGTETPKTKPYEDGSMYKQFMEAQGNVQAGPEKDYTKAPSGMYKQFEAANGNVQAPAVPDHASENRQYLMDKYGLTTGNVQDNPEGDKKAGAKAGEAVGNDISKIDVTKLPQGFNSDLLRANIISKLKSSGRNEWQIAQAMQGIEPQLLGKQREYNDKAFGSLYQQYCQLIQNGQIDDAGMVLAKMKQFNPEQASLLEKQYEKVAGFQAKRDNYKQNVAFLKEIFPEKSDDEIRDMAMGFSGVKGGRLSNGVSGVGRGVKATETQSNFADDGTWTGYTDKQKKEAMQLLKDLKIDVHDPDKMKIAMGLPAVRNAMNIINGIRPAYISHNTNKPWDKNNYQDSYSYAQATLENYLAEHPNDYRGGLDYVKSKMNDNAMATGIVADMMSEYGLNKVSDGNSNKGSSKNTEESTKETNWFEPKEQDKTPLFAEGWYEDKPWYIYWKNAQKKAAELKAK